MCALARSARGALLLAVAATATPSLAQEPGRLLADRLPFDRLSRDADSDISRRHGLGQQQPRQRLPRRNPYDQIVISEMFFGEFNRESSAYFLAFTETYLRSNTFSNTQQANNFFRQSLNHYRSVESAPQLSEIIRGGLKAGVRFGFALPEALATRGTRAGGALEALIDGHGVYEQAQRYIDSLKARRNVEDYSQLFNQVQIWAATDPGMAHPILKEFVTRRSDATDAEYALAVGRLRSSKTDVWTAQAALSGEIGRTTGNILGELATLRDQLARMEATGARAQDVVRLRNAVLIQVDALATIAEQTATIQEKLGALASAWEEQQAEAQRAARAQEFRQSLDALATTISNLGSLLRWHPPDVQRTVAAINGAAMIAGSGGSPLEVIAGLSTIANGLFGRSGPSPEEIILDALVTIRTEMHERFGRIETGLRQLGEAVENLSRDIDARFERVDQSLGRLASGQRRIAEQLRRGFDDVMRALQEQRELSERTVWSDLVQSVAATDRAFFRRFTHSGTQAEAAVYESQYQRTTDELRRHWGRLLIIASFDNVGFGSIHRIGPAGCTQRWLTEAPRSEFEQTLRERGQQLAALVREPHPRAEGRCVSEFLQTLWQAIPSSLAIPPRLRPIFARLPGTLDIDGVFRRSAELPLFAPYDLLVFAERVESLLNELPDPALRAELTGSLEAHLEPAYRVARLLLSADADVILRLAARHLRSQLDAEARAIRESTTFRSLLRMRSAMLSDLGMDTAGIEERPGRSGVRAARILLRNVDSIASGQRKLTLGPAADRSTCISFETVNRRLRAGAEKLQADSEARKSNPSAANTPEAIQEYRAGVQELISAINSFPQIVDAALACPTALDIAGERIPLRLRLQRFAARYLSLLAAETVLRGRLDAISEARLIQPNVAPAAVLVGGRAAEYPRLWDALSALAESGPGDQSAGARFLPPVEVEWSPLHPGFQPNPRGFTLWGSGLGGHGLLYESDSGDQRLTAPSTEEWENEIQQFAIALRNIEMLRARHGRGWINRQIYVRTAGEAVERAIAMQNEVAAIWANPTLASFLQVYGAIRVRNAEFEVASLVVPQVLARYRSGGGAAELVSREIDSWFAPTRQRPSRCTSSGAESTAGATFLCASWAGNAEPSRIADALAAVAETQGTLFRQLIVTCQPAAHSDRATPWCRLATDETWCGHWGGENAGFLRRLREGLVAELVVAGSRVTLAASYIHRGGGGLLNPSTTLTLASEDGRFRSIEFIDTCTSPAGVGGPEVLAIDVLLHPRTGTTLNR